MRKNIFGRQFKRDTNERKALFKGLISSLVLYGKIETTEEKAKAIKGQVDKLITRVKKNSKNISSDLSFYLNSEAFKKLILNIDKFNKRNAGYTRIIKLGRRLNDNAKMVLMEFVDQIENQISKIEEADKMENKKTITTEKAAVKKKRVVKKEKSK